MFRRKFIGNLTAFAAGSAAAASASRTANFRVKGFTCITCAVGLDTLLMKTPGVIESHSSYEAATTVVKFKPDLVDEKRLRAAISEMGFSATEITP